MTETLLPKCEVCNGLLAETEGYPCMNPSCSNSERGREAASMPAGPRATKSGLLVVSDEPVKPDPAVSPRVAANRKARRKAAKQARRRSRPR